MRKLILIDFSWLYNRYYYVSNYSLNEDNSPYRFVNVRDNLLSRLQQFLSLVEKSYEGSKVMLALDSPTNTLYNYTVFEGYKQNRDKEGKKEVYKFLDFIIVKLIKFLNDKSFSFIKAEGYEADQIIAYLTRKFHDRFNVIIFSGDKDLIQLSAYNNVFISDKFEKGKFLLKSDEDIFKKFKNYKGDDFTRVSTNKRDILKYRSLKGDTSDNLSPVFEGLKDKEAINIIQNYWIDNEELSENKIESIIKELESRDSVLAEKLTTNKKVWLRNYKIMDLYHVPENMKLKRMR